MQIARKLTEAGFTGLNFQCIAKHLQANPQAVEAAVEQLLAVKARVAPEEAPASERALLRILTHALAPWLRDKNACSGLFLLDCFDTGRRLSDDMTMLRLRAFANFARPDLLRAELNRVACIGDYGSDVLIRAARLKIQMNIEPTPEDFRIVWGDPPDSLSAFLTSLDAKLHRFPVNPMVIDRILQLRSTNPWEEEETRQRLRWGTVAKGFIDSLVTITSRWRENGEAEAYQADTEGAKIFRLAEGFLRSVDPFPQHEISRHLEEGRSVIIAMAHLGIWHRSFAALRQMRLPVITVAAGSNQTLQRMEAARGQRLHFQTVGNFQADFLSLVKEARKTPTVVAIVADGPLGGDFVTVDILGRSVPMAQGAATVAYHAKAATFFSGTRWNGHRLQVYLQPGPIAEKGVDRPDWDDQWYEFFSKSIEKILLGPPEDIVAIEAGILATLKSLS